MLCQGRDTDVSVGKGAPSPVVTCASCPGLGGNQIFYRILETEKLVDLTHPLTGQGRWSLAMEPAVALFCFIYPSTHPSTHLPSHPSMHSSIHPSTTHPAIKSVHSSIHPSHSPTHPFIHACIHPSTHPAIHLLQSFTYLSTHPDV